MTRIVITMLVLLAWLRGAAAFELVTPEESRAAQRADHGGAPERSRSISQPRIDITSPADLNAALRSPITIDVRFSSLTNAVVDPASFRVLYGAFRINITERIRRAAKITAEGVRADGAALPAGSHRLFIGIGDTAGAFAEKEVRFQIEAQ